MKIAILGWGSLIWDPRQLPYKGKWLTGGPELPLEFSGVSRDGCLTLVIDLKHGERVPTRYVESSRSNLGDAIADLRDREGTITKKIGFVHIVAGTNSSAEFSDHADIFSEVTEWCKAMGFDTAVWTGLPPQFERETGKIFSVENAVAYLQGLPRTVSKHAFNYIRNAPREVDTPLRRRLKELGLVGRQLPTSKHNTRFEPRRSTGALCGLTPMGGDR